MNPFSSRLGPRLSETGPCDGLSDLLMQFRYQSLESKSDVSVQPNSVTMETGLLSGLKARIEAAPGRKPWVRWCPEKTLGLHGRSNSIGSPIEPKTPKNKRFIDGHRLPRARALGYHNSPLWGSRRPLSSVFTEFG